MLQKAVLKRKLARERRKKHIRKIISGTAERARLVVHRTNRHIYAQLVDDSNERTLSGISSLSPALREELKGKTPLEIAKRVGEAVAQKAKEIQIENVVFDRNGFLYHGRVKAVAEAARAAGLKF
jgi:large subunit ribosomal protein L18